MKQAIKAKLPKDWQEQIGDDRFIVVRASEFGASELVAHGMDPVALGALEGTLYRVDEAKRGDVAG